MAPDPPAGAGRGRSRRLPALLRRLFLSRATAVGIMACVGLLLALSALVPQSAESDPAALDRLRGRRPVLFWVGENLKPQALVQSPWFSLLPGFLCAGICLSLLQRIRQYRRQEGSPPRPASMRFQVTREGPVGGPGAEALRRVKEAMHRAGYEVREAGQGILMGSRGRVGFLGSLLFHVGLLLAFAGVAVSGLTRFHGQILLAEGFPAPFSTDAMFQFSDAKRFPEMGGVTLAIRDFVAVYSPQGTPVDFSLLLTVRRGEDLLEEAQVRVNQAFHWAGFQITLHRYGFAPEIGAWDSSGIQRLDGVAVLQLIPPGKVDSLVMEDGSHLRVRLYPDFATVRGEPATRSLAPVRPVLVYEWLDPRGGVLARGRVERGGVSEVNGYRVAFPALSYWGGFIVARDRGLWFFILGSLLGSLGIGLRLAFPDQAIRVECGPCDNGTLVRVEAGARFFPALHEDQVDRLMMKIAEG